MFFYSYKMQTLKTRTQFPNVGRGHHLVTMASVNKLLLSLLVVLLGTSVLCIEELAETIDDPPKAFFGLELMEEKMDNLQFSFMELFVHVKELGELFTNNQRTIEQNQLETNHLMNVLEDRLAANVSLITSYSKKILDYQTICANHDEIRKELSAMKSHPRGRLTAKTKSAPTIKSCQEANSPTSGIFKMAGINGGDSFDVFCELESFDGGWLVFQQRYNGSVDFYRNWMAYRNGFGDVGGEFWLGLEKIYQLTKEGTWELIVEMKDFHDNYKYARYSEFALGNEREKYALSELGTYSGTAGDSLGGHMGMKFSTYDNDNDTYDSKNCAEEFHGAWWFSNCYYTHLNGQHSDSDDTTAIKWPNSESGLKFTRMMIRKV